MKRRIALALALLLALTLCGCWKKPEPSPAPLPDNTPARGETVTTATPGPEPTVTPMATPEPMETFQPAPENTAQPTPEPLPEETPEPVIVNPSVLASGTFRSDTGTALNLVADWRAAAIDDSTARITITLSLESYSLDIGERRSNILTFNGEDYYFMTDPLEIEGGDFVKTQIYVWSKEVPLSKLSFELAVSWNLKGSYSKKEMDTIELSGSYEYTGPVG
ncbi:MAG: hypothetical protein IKN89_09900 [Oscillospiraceae bacterium]|nr:hypothetical protein [Oscillospiraceae bacterium]